MDSSSAGLRTGKSTSQKKTCCLRVESTSSMVRVTRVRSPDSTIRNVCRKVPVTSRATNRKMLGSSCSSTVIEAWNVRPLATAVDRNEPGTSSVITMSSAAQAWCPGRSDATANASAGLAGTSTKAENFGTIPNIRGRPVGRFRSRTESRKTLNCHLCDKWPP